MQEESRQYQSREEGDLVGHDKGAGRERRQVTRGDKQASKQSTGNDFVETGSLRIPAISTSPNANMQDPENLGGTMGALSLVEYADDLDEEDENEDYDPIKWDEEMLRLAEWKEFVENIAKEFYEEKSSEEEFHMETGHENRRSHKKAVTAGIEEHELVRMADGSAKMAKDIVVGDFVMGSDGSPQEVTEMQTALGEGYEVSIPNPESTWCEKIIVGAAQLFELSIEQLDLHPIHVQARGDMKPRYVVAYRELIRERIVSKEGSIRFITNVHENTISESYDNRAGRRSSRKLAATSEEAKSRLSKKLHARLPKETNGEICLRLRWYAEARDLNHYGPPCKLNQSR